MIGLATHIVDVLTGTTVDAYGDTVDGETVAATGVAVSILEQSRRVDRYDSETPRKVGNLIGRAPYGTPIRDGDRLRHNPSGTIWVVDAVAQNSNPVSTPPMILELRRLP